MFQDFKINCPRESEEIEFRIINKRSIGIKELQGSYKYSKIK